MVGYSSFWTSLKAAWRENNVIIIIKQLLGDVSSYLGKIVTPFYSVDNEKINCKTRTIE